MISLSNWMECYPIIPTQTLPHNLSSSNIALWKENGCKTSKLLESVYQPVNDLHL